MASGESVLGEDWVSVVVPRGGRVPEHVHPVLDDYLDIAAREARAGIEPGTPIIVSPGLDIDRTLIRYFTISGPFGRLNALTRESEGTEIKNWCQFLDSYGVHWLDASERHFKDYRRFRTNANVLRELTGDASGVITVASFAKGHYALKRLYEWVKDSGLRPDNPIPDHVQKGPESADRSRGNWVLPGTYQMWRNVGLSGLRAAVSSSGAVTWAEHDTSWRGGVHATRNSAYTDFMITSALRRREQGTLLLDELPTGGADVRLATETAKFKRSRVYTPNRTALDAVHRYVRFQRASAVERAQRHGRYDDLAAGQDLLIVDRVWFTKDGLQYRLDTGEEGAVDSMDEFDRSRMFRRNEDGLLEPMAVWLNERGLPMKPKEWNRVFARANERVADEFRRIGVTSAPPQLHPHALRFSFALYLLAALHRRIDERENYRATETYQADRYGLAYDVVKDMLGHRSRDTTINIYLQPVQGLRRAAVFDSTVDRDLSEVIGMLVGDSDLVLRTGTVFEQENR